MEEKKEKICIVGLGYVGLPLAVFLAEAGWEVYGYDVSKEKIVELSSGVESMGEVDEGRLKRAQITYSSDPTIIRKATFVIVTVPTPINRFKKPDLSIVKSATETVADNLYPGSVIVYESTVYPGVTEEICLPILTDYGNLEHKKDFFLGYSPERVNPGDLNHTIDKIVKVIAADTPKTLERMEKVYGSICKAGLHKVSCIRAAEAAKVIENTQRDLNIALVNELALIFHRMGINTNEVIEAASTKWNFHKYHPGFVGGHCYSGSQRVTLLNGRSHKVRTLIAYFNELQRKKMVRTEHIGNTALLYPKETIKILSFNRDFHKSEFAPVRAFSIHSGGAGLRITTAGNHHIEVSSKHPMIVDEEGEWFIKHACDLKTGDRLPLLQNVPQRTDLRKEVDLIAEMPVSWHARYRVKRRSGTWREIKDSLEIKKHTGRKSSNFYYLDYLPLTVYLALEKRGIMPVPRKDVILVSGRGGGSFQTVPAVVSLNADFARLIGYYLSEGCITHDKTTRVRFTFNRDEKETIEDCKELIRRLGVRRFSQSEDRQWNTTHIKLSSELIGFLFEKVLCVGLRSEDARIPEELLYADNDIRWNLLTGLLRGDGGVDWNYSHHPYRKNGKVYAHARNSANVSYFSISPELFHGVQLLLMSFMIPFTLDSKRPLLEIHGTDNLKLLRKCFLDAKKLKLDNYFSHKVRAPKSKLFKRYQGYVTVPIRRIEQVALPEMYSVEVAKTHTVVTDSGLITHNCIGVDPYYLVYKAKALGYHPEIITAGRKINDSMPYYVAQEVVKMLIHTQKAPAKSKVLVVGLTFKEDVKDCRNSRAKDLIDELKEYKMEVYGHDPLVDKEMARSIFGVENLDWEEVSGMDGIVFVNKHRVFLDYNIADFRKKCTQRPIIFDIKSFFDSSKARQSGFVYRNL